MCSSREGKRYPRPPIVPSSHLFPRVALAVRRICFGQARPTPKVVPSAHGRQSRKRNPTIGIAPSTANSFSAKVRTTECSLAVVSRCPSLRSYLPSQFSADRASFPLNRQYIAGAIGKKTCLLLCARQFQRQVRWPKDGSRLLPRIHSPLRQELLTIYGWRLPFMIVAGRAFPRVCAYKACTPGTQSSALHFMFAIGRSRHDPGEIDRTFSC